jgi:hypothetical protein
LQLTTLCDTHTAVLIVVIIIIVVPVVILVLLVSAGALKPIMLHALSNSGNGILAWRKHHCEEGHGAEERHQKLNIKIWETPNVFVFYSLPHPNTHTHTHTRARTHTRTHTHTQKDRQ